MKIGIVGYQGSGKSTLFEWLTGVAPDPSKTHQGQAAMAMVSDPRVPSLSSIYKPKKITLASLELVDTPGLARDHEGNASRLALIRQTDCLLLVVAGFGRTDPVADLRLFEEDMVLADLEVVTGRIERLRQSLKKPRPTRDQDQAEIDALQPLAAQLESGDIVEGSPLNEAQSQAIRSFGLLSIKPRMVVLNVADDDDQPDRWLQRVRDTLNGTRSVVAIPVGLQLELFRMSPEDRDDIVREMQLVEVDRDEVLRGVMDASGQMLFFTAGEKEVRCWMAPKGSTAWQCAAGIHTDMARGFIRAEVMPSEELIRLGSEREMKAHGLVRQEPKDYVVHEGDVLLIKFNV